MASCAEEWKSILKRIEKFRRSAITFGLKHSVFTLSSLMPDLIPLSKEVSSKMTQPLFSFLFIVRVHIFERVV